MSLDAMKQAVEALEYAEFYIKSAAEFGYSNRAVAKHIFSEAIADLRAAIEQTNEFNPDWDAMAVMVEEQQRMAKRIEELEAQQKPWVKSYAGGKPNYTTREEQPDELMIWKSRAMSAERIIEKFMQPEPAPGYCKHCKQYSIEEPLPSQKEQKPVAWMHPSWIDPDTRGWSNDSFSAIPIEGWVPVYTTPRQWQGLTDDEVSEILDREIGFNSCFGPETDFARAIEAKLKEKNHG